MDHLGPQVGDQEAPEGEVYVSSEAVDPSCITGGFDLKCQKNLYARTQQDIGFQLQVGLPISLTGVGLAVQEGPIDNEDKTERRQINKEAVSAVCSSFSSDEGKKLREKLKAVTEKHNKSSEEGQSHHGVRGYMDSLAPLCGDAKADNQILEEQPVSGLKERSLSHSSLNNNKGEHSETILYDRLSIQVIGIKLSEMVSVALIIMVFLQPITTR